MTEEVNKLTKAKLKEASAIVIKVSETFVLYMNEPESGKPNVHEELGKYDFIRSLGGEGKKSYPGIRLYLKSGEALPAGLQVKNIDKLFDIFPVISLHKHGESVSPEECKEVLEKRNIVHSLPKRVKKSDEPATTSEPEKSNDVEVIESRLLSTVLKVDRLSLDDYVDRQEGQNRAK